MNPADLLATFAEVADAVATAVGALSVEERRATTAKAHQYALDLVADEAALRVLERAPLRVVSEESGVGGRPDASVTVVLDPVDGSTNASRGVPYWSTSLAAVDGDGLVAALVVNQAAGERFTAVRGEGAWRDGEVIDVRGATQRSDTVVGVVAPHRMRKGFAHSRTLGSAALELCEVAAGAFDGYADGVGYLAPWDYLGAVLVCREAGVSVEDAKGRELVVTDPSERRQVVAANTSELLAELREALP